MEIRLARKKAEQLSYAQTQWGDLMENVKQVEQMMFLPSDKSENSKEK
jgi:hypothetical protein